MFSRQSLTRSIEAKTTEFKPLDLFLPPRILSRSGESSKERQPGDGGHCQRTMGNNRIVFVSDVHLDHLVPDRMDRFDRFLSEDLPNLECSHLYLLGDIFNIWYRDARIQRKYGQRIFDRLIELSQSGIHLEMVVGNRDFALCFDRRLSLPFPVHPTRIRRTHGGLDFLLCHGDDLCTRDWGYRLLHGIIRRRIPMAVFHSLSSDPKEWIVQKLINLTHEVTKRKPFWKTQPYWPYMNALVDEGMDVCIQGHRHYRSYRILEGARRTGRLFVLPRWGELASGIVFDPEDKTFSFFDR